MPTKREAIVWCESENAPFVRALAKALDLTVIAMGTPANDHEPIDGAEPISDIRHALRSTDADLAILMTARASSGDPPAGDLLDDASLLRDARERLGRIITTHPFPTSVHHAPLPGEAGRSPAVFVPRFVALESFREAREALETFEPVRSLAFSARGAPAHTTLGAQLLDAMMTVHAVLGVPESIDASVVTPEHTAGIHRAPPEELGALRGDLTANMRFASSRAASLALSDRGGRWFRGASLVGSHGCVRIDDRVFESIAPDGTTLDATTPNGDDNQTEPAVRAFARAIESALDPHAPPAAQQDMREVLSMCQAAILSSRTGEPESPATIMRLSRAV